MVQMGIVHTLLDLIRYIRSGQGYKNTYYLVVLKVTRGQCHYFVLAPINLHNRLNIKHGPFELFMPYE